MGHACIICISEGIKIVYLKQASIVNIGLKLLIEYIINHERERREGGTEGGEGREGEGERERERENLYI